MRDFVVTKNQQGRAEGRRYVVFPVGTQPAIMSSAEFRAPPIKNCSSGTSSAIEASLFNGQLHSGDTKSAVQDKCSQNLRFWYLYSQNICLGPEGVS